MERAFFFVTQLTYFFEGVTGQETTIDPVMQQLVPFGSSGAKFDFTSTPPAWCLPDDSGDSAFGGEKTQGISLMGWNPLADGGQTLSWPGSYTPSDHSFPWDSTPPSSVTSHSQGSINQNDLLFVNSGGETKDVGTAMEDNCSAETVPNAYLSQADPNPCDPHTAHSESTQPHNVRS